MQSLLKKTWNFIWKDDSLLSWIVNLILAFIIVKFLVYPGLGLLLGTSLPVVAVVSSSMEHNANFDDWWAENEAFYLNNNIEKEEFEEFQLKNGFNKGDIVFLRGKQFDDIEVGDILVYDNPRFNFPIIHRVIEKNEGFITKGDNNEISDSEEINRERVRGIGVLKVPFLGWIKIWFIDILNAIGG